VGALSCFSLPLGDVLTDIFSIQVFDEVPAKQKQNSPRKLKRE